LSEICWIIFADEEVEHWIYNSKSILLVVRYRYTMVMVVVVMITWT